ncbi:hypothetical protein NEIMUCOT_04713 [Neisseria mucosa ATCC 25996]|uniref:Uncharacterized protein n=1 Tax=Neisseria mucosa (strain ATCC 25996 / DSM 4631 / NCTC 10774 / M26) TaxID=546266 RepID=D2ZVS0_NEIM2|nr:hypothetical protein NEIMUCOT_04713 [Neisseria mucosa ATCC 25996]
MAGKAKRSSEKPNSGFFQTTFFMRRHSLNFSGVKNGSFLFQIIIHS